MRRFWIGLLLGMLWLNTSPGGAQSLEKPKKGKITFQIESTGEDKGKKPSTAPAKEAGLEENIAAALKNNPDLRVAEAKAREAEAELARTRMKVISDISTLHVEIQAAEAALREAQVRYDVANNLYEKRKSITWEDFRDTRLILTKIKVELAAKQARLPYLLGKQAVGQSSSISMTLSGPDGHVFFPSALVLVTKKMNSNSPLTAKLRKALDQMMTVKIKKASDEKLIEEVRKRLPGINVQYRAPRFIPPAPNAPDEEINIDINEPIPTGAFLQYLEDERRWTFVLRDYGVIITEARDRLPPGALRVVDFWKQRSSDGSPPPATGEKTAP